MAKADSALVIGGGIAGIQASLDITQAGFKVYLVEREPSLGGHLAQLSYVFPALEDASSLLNYKLAELSRYPKIELFTCSEVIQVTGEKGNFLARIKRQPRYVDAADFHQKEVVEEVNIGVIIVATGYELFDARLKPEYGYGFYPNVITNLELERLLSKSGPTGGEIIIDGREPKRILFIQCVGSRDKQVGNEYCSQICCMNSTKQAILIKERLPDAWVGINYIDVRACGKGGEEFYQEAQSKGVIYRHGIISEIYQGDNSRVIVRGEESLISKPYEEEADLVVLANGMVPSRGSEYLAEILKLSRGSDNFFLEAHPKLNSVGTTSEGILLAGCAQGPKDIANTIVQARAAAGKACQLLQKSRM